MELNKLTMEIFPRLDWNLDSSTRPSTPPPHIPSKRGKDASAASKSSDKDGLYRGRSPVIIEKNEKPKRRSRNKVLMPWEQCIHVARWIPHGLDMFCDLKQVIQVCLLLEQEEAAKDGDEMEEEEIKCACRKILDDCDELTRARYKRTFKYVTENSPYLGTLIGRRKKHEELTQLIGEVSPNPDKDLVRPPITDNSKSHAQMGFNHVQLGKMLCPAKYLVNYIKDLHGMKNKFDSGSLRVIAALWPAYLYPGNIAGEDFDPEDILEGLFHGYLLERVTEHIFTSTSSALKAGISNGTCACNAKLHGMAEVEAEHIAYAMVQVNVF
ncbi:hypothetical protein BD769DRAFT_1382415 [Suillus cothurnatus]|nr:hypothetical protein BD769DRAFT_1382415 [Suillus cothurnatus]